MQTKVVITGSNGLLGQNLLELLLKEKEKYQIFGFSRGENRSGRTDFEYVNIDITNEDLLSRTVEQWQHLAVDKTLYQPYEAPLLSIWPNITEGDKLLLWNKQGRSEFYYNNRFVGAIEDAYFGELFLSIWLSEQTSQPDLRAQLLGLTKREE